ncbi:GSCOCG00007823001-RA-CDS, partial [Cotesia congregata]
MGTNEEDINALKKRIAELEKENAMVIVKNIYMEEVLKKHKKSIVWADIPPPASSTVNVPSSGSGSHSNETESSENCNKIEKINNNEKIIDEGKIDEEKSKKVVQKTKFLNENLDPVASSSNGSNDEGNNVNSQQKNIPFTITSVVDKNIKLHPSKGQLRVGSKTDQNDVKKNIDQSTEQSKTIEKNLKQTDSSTEHSSSSSKNIKK